MNVRKELNDFYSITNGAVIVDPRNISENANVKFLGTSGSGKAFSIDSLHIPENANMAFLGTPGSGKAFCIVS